MSSVKMDICYQIVDVWHVKMRLFHAAIVLNVLIVEVLIVEAPNMKQPWWLPRRFVLNVWIWIS